MTDNPEPVTIGFKVKESDGSNVLHLDGYSTAAVDGGYDALRAANVAKANDDTETANTALGIVEACSTRAREAAKALVADAGKRAAECMKPGGKAAERERMRLCLRGALKATRVGYKRR